MPLTIQEEDGRFYPRIVCDHCFEVIADATDGNYEWRWEPDSDFGSRPYFTHKKCSWDFGEARRRDKIFLWCPLECLPIFLGYNLALNWKAAHREALRLGAME